MEPLTPEQQDLVVKYRPFALSLAKKWSRRGTDPDVAQAVLLGFCQAAATWDPAKGVYPTWAFWWGLKAAQDEMRKRSVVTVGAKLARKGAKSVQVELDGLDWEPSYQGASVEQENDLRALLAAAKLSQIELQVLLARKVCGCYLREVGLGLSRERIRQIERDALEVVHRTAKRMDFRL